MPMGTSGEQKLRAWFAARIPADWFIAEPDLVYDRDEILVLGRLAEPRTPGGDGAEAALCLQEIERFRENTRATRVRIAAEAEVRFGRKVGWGASCGPVRQIFTALTVPVMTRLRIDDRRVLDTLVEASIARSRSEALAWCVRLVRDHEDDWIAELRDALVHVDRVRSAGPRPTDHGGDEL
jgi:hypothetical protein